MFSYPHTIENGLGERLTFLRRVATPDGDMLEVENCVQPDVGPPMHVHHQQEESLTVVSGRIGYQRNGQPPQFAGPGGTAIFLAGESHRFWNAGSVELRCTGYISPPGNFEYFLRGIYEAQKKSGSMRPDAFQAAYLMWRYRSEFQLDEIPSFVRRFVFPIQVCLGRILGKYGKFADAPPAVPPHTAPPRKIAAR